MFLSKAELMEEIKLKTEVIEISPEKSVIISELSGSDYMKLWNSCVTDTGEVDENGDKKILIDNSIFNPSLLAYGIVDENGDRIFSDDDIPFLKTKASSEKMRCLIEPLRKLNGIGGDEGNDSEPTPSGSSIGE